MMDINPNNPEAMRLQQLKMEAMQIANSMPQITGVPLGGLPAAPPRPPTPEEMLAARMKEMMQMAAFQKSLSRPTPEPAKMTEYLVLPQQHTYEESKDSEGKKVKVLKGGDAPEPMIIENYGALSKDIKLSKLTPKEVRVLDIKMEAMRIVAHWTHKAKDINAKYLLHEENAEIMNYGAVRRAVDGFERVQETKTTMENIQTLHTENQMQYQKQKSGIWGLLSGGK